MTEAEENLQMQMQTNKDIASRYQQYHFSLGGGGNPMQTTFRFSNIEILAVQMTEICTMLVQSLKRRVPTNSAANKSVVHLMSILDVIHL